MGCNRTNLRRCELAADRQHQIARVVASFAGAPLAQLLGEIGGRLSAERRVARANSFTVVAVTGRAGKQAARRIALAIERRGRRRRRLMRRERQRCIIGRDRLPVGRVEPAGDRRHLRVRAAPARIVVELPCQVASVDRRQPRRAVGVATPVESMTGEAGVGGAGVAPAQCHQSPRRGEGVGRARRLASRERDQRERRERAAWGTRFHTPGNSRRSPMVPEMKFSGRAPGLEGGVDCT